LVSRLTRKARTARRVLKDEGIGGVGKVAFDHAKLKLDIYVRGRNRTVNLDGCNFALRELPETNMKLELLNGGYEKPERFAARKYIQPEWPVVELGGCIGVVACITNKLLQNPKAHVVLEANPMAVPYLEANREANGCSFKIVNQAIAYDSDKVTFTPSLDFCGNSVDRNVSTEVEVTVPATQLSRILEDEQFQKYALICDIEGQEYELVMREAEAIRKAEVVIMEIHPHIIGEQETGALISRLENLGFRIAEQSALVWVFSKN